MKKTWLAIALFTTIIALETISTLVKAENPQIRTDKTDYTPGETVTITGSSFVPTESYAIPVIRPDGTMVKGDGTFTPSWDTVQTDENGEFTYYYQLDGIEGLYTVNVYSSLWTGDTSEPPITSTTFTDAHGATPDVDFTRTAHYTRTFGWTIDKSVTPATWDLFTGDSGTSNYTISVTKDSGTDHSWIDGIITVTNTGDRDTEGLAITVMVTIVGTGPQIDIGPNTVDVTSNPVIPDGESQTYPYSIDVPVYTGAEVSYQVKASAGVTNPKTGDNPKNKIQTINDPFRLGPTLINNEINVDDYVNNVVVRSWGPFSSSDSVTFTETYTADKDEGTHTDTVKIKELPDQTDSASVTVNCYHLEVTKDASTSFTRTYGWSIDKSADQTELHLAVGQSSSVGYTVEVGSTGYIDSDWAVSGKISIHNPAPIDAVINSLSDLVSPDIAGTVEEPAGGFPYTLASGETLYLTYTADLPDATSRTNVATATLQNHAYDYDGTSTELDTTNFASDLVDVIFSSNPTTEVDKSIDVSDSLHGSLGTLTYGSDTLPHTYTYSETIGPYDAIGEYTIGNTASVKSGTTTLTNDDWTVTAYVEGSQFCAITSRGYEDIDVFKLIFTPDVPTNPGYSRLTASNPGQFSFNVFYDAQEGDEEFTITIPYPFVTQGANPVHIYDTEPSGYTPTGTDITSQFTLSGVPLTLSGTFGSTAEITITNNEYTGPMYITVHLDYGLKKIAGGYSKDLDSNANANTGKSTYESILNNQPYEFSVSGPFSDDDTINNLNVFKNDPGIGGLVLDAYGNPIAGMKVTIYVSGSTKPLGTVYTDADGWYMLNYKWTGKAVTFTVNLPDGTTKTGTLKANGFVVVNFP